MVKRAQISGLKPIGALKASQAAQKLMLMGDEDVARDIRRAMKMHGADPRFSALIWPFPKRPVPAYKYTEHAFGYIPKAAPGTVPSTDIKDAGNITADASLKGQNIKITLDRLRVYQYPGEGIHTILFDFYAQHQTPNAGETQDLHFTQNYRVQEGSGAGITGYPVFVGLKVGNEGVSFKCFTVNVKNDDDQKVLGFLGSDVFKKGLQLVNTVNPVVPIVSGFATGIVDAFAHRNDNVPVQDFYMGLDFSSVQTRAQLREGSYVAVQVPDAVTWDWSQWVFKPANGQIVSKGTPSTGVPFNYVVFSVSGM
jgi:hypothetical protein